MSQVDFKIGDTVRLRSGGPDMAVRSVEDGKAYCEWFVEKKEVRGHAFPFPMLEPASAARQRTAIAVRGMSH